MKPHFTIFAQSSVLSFRLDIRLAPGSTLPKMFGRKPFVRLPEPYEISVHPATLDEWDQLHSFIFCSRSDFLFIFVIWLSFLNQLQFVTKTQLLWNLASARFFNAINSRFLIINAKICKISARCLYPALGRIKVARGPGHWRGARPLFSSFSIHIYFKEISL